MYFSLKLNARYEPILPRRLNLKVFLIFFQSKQIHLINKTYFENNFDDKNSSIIILSSLREMAQYSNYFRPVFHLIHCFGSRLNYINELFRRLRPCHVQLVFMFQYLKSVFIEHTKFLIILSRLTLD